METCTLNHDLVGYLFRIFLQVNLLRFISGVLCCLALIGERIVIMDRISILIRGCRITRCKGKPPDFTGFPVIVVRRPDHYGVTDLLHQVIISEIQPVHFELTVFDRSRRHLGAVFQSDILKGPGVRIAVPIVIHKNLLLF